MMLTALMMILLAGCSPQAIHILGAMGAGIAASHPPQQHCTMICWQGMCEMRCDR